VDCAGACHRAAPCADPLGQSTLRSDLIVKQRTGMGPLSRGMRCPRFYHFSPSHRAEGAGKTGCALHPRSRVQMDRRECTRAYRFSGGNPAFPAQWFYGL
jgi:hypothetical protein